MKRAVLTFAALAAILTAAAAPVRTATENFVTNKIAEAVAAIPAPDFSTNNTELVATIEAKAPAPGNYPAVSDVAMSALSRAEAEAKFTMLQEELESGAITVNNAFNADEADRAVSSQNSIYAYSLYNEDTDEDRIAGAIFAQLDAATETNAAQSAAIAAIPAVVTNIVREANGGIWDAALEVWWTPRMRNGSLTYEATTNVNLNAEN